ncbi:MAG TPA: WD40 repeat domain-containing protein [Candidatus Cybelea sp.]|nr:WD40 repeat domain-containing protein [Candidatus Cybelea sp.]
MAEKPIRIFVSSPADVRPERLLAERIIARLDREFAYHFHVEAVLWEREPLVASRHFQDPQNIPEPSGTDIVVVILWSQLGSLLPADRYRGAISGRAVTGTEWEFEDALKSAREKNVPELLLYRKTKSVTASLDDDVELERQREQKRLVDDFMGRWFGKSDAGTTVAASSTFATPQEFEEKLYDHLRAILERRAGGEDTSLAIRWYQPPFRGLLSFEYEHAPLFFGRTRARNEVRELLAAREAAGKSFVLVLGASGSGKSSLVKAAVLPDLMLPGMIGRVALCRYAIVRPSDDPADIEGALAAAILSDTGLPELKTLHYTKENLARALRGGPEQTALVLKQGLTEACKSADLTKIAEARLVLIVDQMEEIFTLVDDVSDDARSRFTAALDALARSGLVWIIATMRSDFFDRLESVPALAELADAQARYLLLPPTDSELGQMIREPAREAGLRFEIDPADGTPLDERIRRAATDREALPLLSFVLDELWKRRSERGLLSVRAYEELGGLEGALARRAEEEYAAQPDDVRAALPNVLHAIVTVGQEAQITSKAAPIAGFADESPERRLIEAFAAPSARLFVKDVDGIGTESRVRPAHEALLTHWTRAKEYIEENRADLQLEARLGDAAARWKSAGEVRGLLLPAGLPLEEATDLLHRCGDQLPSDLAEFIRQSDKAAKSGARLRRIVVVSVMLALALLTVVSLSALYFAERSRNEALVAQSRFLARDAQNAIDRGDAVLGMLLALEALPQRIDQPDRPFVLDAEAALESGLAQQRERLVLPGREAGAESAAFSPDGTRIVTAYDDHTAQVSDARSGAPVAVLRGHQWIVTAAGFSPDGKRIVTASWDRTARVWDAKTGALLMILPGHDILTSASFSPDGTRIVTAGLNGMVGIWNAQTGKPLSAFRGSDGTVYAATFSPDGTRIVTASDDTTARVWNARTGAQLLVLRGHESDVQSARFSPDGKLIVTAANDKTVRVWSAVTGAQLSVLSGHDGLVRSAAFSPDGKLIVSSSADNTARLWDARTGVMLAAFAGHEGSVNSAAFSPDGRSIVTASDDKTVRVWDASVTRASLVMRNANFQAAFSPDGTRVVTASWDDHAARVWDAKTGAALVAVQGPDRRVESAGFSPDGTRIVTGMGDKTARVWDARTGAPLVALRGHKGIVVSAEFSPDGTRIATASWDGTARIWNARTGAMLSVLRVPDEQVYDAAFSPDGSQIAAVSSDGVTHVWDLGTLRELFALPGDPGGKSVAFSRDGGRILTGEYKTAHVWDAKTGALVLILRGHEDWVRGSAFSPDGNRIVTASEDATARIWDAQTGAPLIVLRGDKNGIESAAFSPDGTRVVTASLDDTVRIWDARTAGLHCQALVDRARASLPRQISQTERAREFLDRNPFEIFQLYVVGGKCE